MSDLDWLLEIALMAMLAATMFHALRLERALGVLRRDRSALEALIAGFNESTLQAEGGVERLRSAADGAGRQIARQVDQARSLKGDLDFLLARGEQLADRLEVAVRSRAALDPVAIEAPLEAVPGPGATTFPEPEGRLRSRAEKDLLRALRAAR